MQLPVNNKTVNDSFNNVCFMMKYCFVDYILYMLDKA